jgi:hypothetical protein
VHFVTNKQLFIELLRYRAGQGNHDNYPAGVRIARGGIPAKQKLIGLL